jgi:hypothetical protein
MIGSDSGRMRKPNGTLTRASAEAAKAGALREEAQEAAEDGAGDQAEPEGGSDQAKSAGAICGRGAVGYVGLGGRQSSASAAGQGDGRDQQR